MILRKPTFNPSMISGCELWLDANDSSTMRNTCSREFLAADNVGLVNYSTSGLAYLSNYSFGVWVTVYNTGSINNHAQSILSNRSYISTIPVAGQIIYNPSLNNFQFQVRDNDSTLREAPGPTSVQTVANRMYCVVGTRNNDTLLTYVNGVAGISPSILTPWVSPISANSIIIGQSFSAGGLKLSGIVHCAAIWTGTLNSTQVSQFYNNGAPLPFNNISGSVRSLLSNYWSLGESSGVAFDRVGGVDLQPSGDGLGPLATLRGFDKDLYNGGAVTQWRDKSGKNRLARQRQSGHFAPTYISNNPGLLFNQTLKYLDLDYQFSDKNIWNDGSRKGMTLVSSYKLNSTGVFSILLYLANSGSASFANDQIGFFAHHTSLNSPTTSFSDYNEIDFSINDFTTSIPNINKGKSINSNSVFVSTINTGIIRLYHNGDTSSSVSSNSNLSDFYAAAIGARRRGLFSTDLVSDVKINEIALYNTELNQTQINQLINYMNSKWSTAPSQISGLSLWIDGSDESSMLFANANRISGIFSKDGSNILFTAFPNSNQPSLINYPNGKTAISFDCNSCFSGNYTVRTGNTTMFLVYRPMGISREPTIGSAPFAGTISTNRYYIGGISATNQPFFGRGNSALGSGALSYNTTYINTAIYSGFSSAGLYINGNLNTPITSGFGGIAGGANGFFIGAGAASPPPLSVSGIICEFILYNNVLQNQDRSSIEYYLSRKWGVDIV